MSRRARAVAFLAGALVCAVLAAGLANGYERSLEEQLGELRPAVLAREAIPPRRAISARRARRALEVRRVPERFLPPGTLEVPSQAIGLAPAGALVPGSYLLADQLAPPRRRGRKVPRVARGLTPLEIEVSGASPLAAGGSLPKRVDVVVTSEPGPGGRGRTYLAAKAVELLDLVESTGSAADDPLAPGSSPAFSATLAVRRASALRLIEAQNFARELRLIPSG